MSFRLELTDVIQEKGEEKEGKLDSQQNSSHLQCATESVFFSSCRLFHFKVQEKIHLFFVISICQELGKERVSRAHILTVHCLQESLATTRYRDDDSCALS
jgi:hypothetical protein